MPVQKSSPSEPPTVEVVVETPRGSRNKYAFEPERNLFQLRKVLPAGMAYPYDFGFVPGTRAEDGDPIDVLLLMDEPAYPGILVPARLIGVIEGEQSSEGKSIRNDRLLAVAESSHLYANVDGLDHLPNGFLHEIGEFFVNYRRLEGKQYRLLGAHGSQEAYRLLDRARA